MVECEEDFNLVLTLNTFEDNIFLGNNSTAITLMDSDGIISTSNKDASKTSSLSVAASFSVPTMERVAESDLTLELCVSMTTVPPGAELATQVDLTLSTMSGSGKVNTIYNTIGYIQIPLSN